MLRREVRYIEWIDSAGGSAGWRPLSAVLRDVSVVTIMSVGFVINENDREVTLLQSADNQIGEAQSADNWISIPKIAIKKSRSMR